MNKKRHNIIIVIIVFGAIIMCCLCFNPREHIKTVRLNDGTVIQIWEDRDLVHSLPITRYKVTYRGKVVIPPTLLWVNSRVLQEVTTRPRPYNLLVAYAENQTLVCIYNFRYSEDFVVLYDTQTQTSWPPAWTSESDTDADSWKARYAKLKAENPDLPMVEYLEN